MTTTNIISAFRSTGIYLTDSGVVGEDAFNCNSNRQTIKRSGLHSNGCQPVYLHLIDNRYHLLVIRPQKKLPKAGTQKTGHTRQKIKSAILTHTPEKERLELEHAAKTMKQKATSKVSVTAKKPQQIKQKQNHPEPSDEEHLSDH